MRGERKSRRVGGCLRWLYLSRDAAVPCSASTPCAPVYPLFLFPFRCSPSPLLLVPEALSHDRIRRPRDVPPRLPRPLAAARAVVRPGGCVGVGGVGVGKVPRALPAVDLLQHLVNHCHDGVPAQQHATRQETQRKETQSAKVDASTLGSLSSTGRLSRRFFLIQEERTPALSCGKAHQSQPHAMIPPSARLYDANVTPCMPLSGMCRGSVPQNHSAAPYTCWVLTWKGAERTL